MQVLQGFSASVVHCMVPKDYTSKGFLIRIVDVIVTRQVEMIHVDTIHTNFLRDNIVIFAFLKVNFMEGVD